MKLYLTPQQSFSIRDKYSKLKYIPYQCGTVIYALPAELSTRDNYSPKYIPYPCGTVFYTPPAEFSIRDKYGLKYIPYPCGTVFLHSPREAFNKR